MRRQVGPASWLLLLPLGSVSASAGSWENDLPTGWEALTNEPDDETLAGMGWEPATRGRALEPFVPDGVDRVGSGTYLRREVTLLTDTRQLGGVRFAFYCARGSATKEITLDALVGVFPESLDSLRVQVDGLEPQTLHLFPNRRKAEWKNVSVSVPRPEDFDLHRLTVLGRGLTWLRAFRVRPESCMIAREARGVQDLSEWQFKDPALTLSGDQLIDMITPSFFATSAGAIAMRASVHRVRSVSPVRAYRELNEKGNGWGLAGLHALQLRVRTLQLPLGAPEMNITSIRNMRTGEEIATLRVVGSTVKHPASFWLQVVVHADDGMVADLSSLSTQYKGICRHPDLGNYELATDVHVSTETGGSWSILGQTIPINVSTDGSRVSMGDTWTQFEARLGANGSLSGNLSKDGVFGGSCSFQPSFDKAFYRNFNAMHMFDEPVDILLRIDDGVLSVAALNETFQRPLHGARFFQDRFQFALGPHCEFSFAHSHVVDRDDECRVRFDGLLVGHKP